MTLCPDRPSPSFGFRLLGGAAGRAATATSVLLDAPVLSGGCETNVEHPHLFLCLSHFPVFLFGSVFSPPFCSSMPHQLLPCLVPGAQSQPAIKPTSPQIPCSACCWSVASSKSGRALPFFHHHHYEPASTTLFPLSGRRARHGARAGQRKGARTSTAWPP